MTADIKPRCPDGSVPPPNSNCQVGDLTKPPAIVFLFIGFSNCDIEICGGNSGAWDGKGDTNPNNPNGHLKGQPCSTQCRNLNYPGGGTPWNKVTKGGWDQVDQLSFLRQVYPDGDPTHWLVGSHVVVFNSAWGGQTLNKWDPTAQGYYANSNDCEWGDESSNPECNYVRTQHELEYNGYSEAQVQAIFLKSSNSFPQCSLKRQYCAVTDPPPIPDAYLSETYLGNIMRYLKCCTLDEEGNSTGVPRHPNLKQVFITSRIYGGYADPNNHGCLMPEPFAYEEGFAVQRLIVAQINQAAGGGPTQYAETLTYNLAPWFDWGPYLWASGVNISPGSELNWCDSTTTTNFRCSQNLNPGDFRYGDVINTQYFGDHTHPTATGTQKVAGELVKFVQGNLQGPQHFISDWVTPWILSR